jgi:hypothetical protein
MQVLVIMALAFTFSLQAQTWKTEIYRIDGKEGMKILKLRPEMHVRITTLLERTDSLKNTTIYRGRFISSSGDSILLKVKEIQMTKAFTNGINEHITMSGKYFETKPGATDIYGVAVPDIDMLCYQNKGLEKISAAEDYLLFGSLIVLILSPFICYNYKDGEFNEDLYQYLGLGCTAGIVLGFGLQMAGGERELLFDSSFSSKKKKIWSYKK